VPSAPGRRGRKCAAPTSGNSPMPHSGKANTVLRPRQRPQAMRQAGAGIVTVMPTQTAAWRLCTWCACACALREHCSHVGSGRAMLHPLLTLCTPPAYWIQENSPNQGPARRSVATRKRPCTDTPAPPPMQMPSSSAMCGFFSWPRQWFSSYSCRKNLPARARGWAAASMPASARQRRKRPAGLRNRGRPAEGR